MGTVGIVCDSTCDLGPTWLADHDIVMAPLKMTLGAADRHVVDTGHLCFALDTLEYLVKGGAGKAQGRVASLLNIKPVLTFDAEGAIEPYKKVKGTKKAMQEIAQMAFDAAGPSPVKAGIFHAQARDPVEELRALIAPADVPREIVHCASVGAVIGTYAVPRAIGLTLYPLS